jgi:hypothetical protein
MSDADLEKAIIVAVGAVGYYEAADGWQSYHEREAREDAQRWLRRLTNVRAERRAQQTAIAA